MAELEVVAGDGEDVGGGEGGKPIGVGAADAAAAVGRVESVVGDVGAVGIHGRAVDDRAGTAVDCGRMLGVDVGAWGCCEAVDGIVVGVCWAVRAHC